MDLEKIKNKIKEKGLKQNYIASRLNITETALSRKLIGKNLFTINEIKELCILLDLSKEEKLKFFLN